MKKTKLVLVVIMAIVTFIIAIISTKVFAADFNEIGQADFDEAFATPNIATAKGIIYQNEAGKQEGFTLADGDYKLTENVNLSSEILLGDPNSKGIMLDLNNKTIKSTGQAVIYLGGNNVTIQNGSLENVDASYEKYSVYGSSTVETNDVVTINNVTFKGTFEIYGFNVRIKNSAFSTGLALSGCTAVLDNLDLGSTGMAFTSCNITINSGKYVCQESFWDCKLVINGGTFGLDNDMIPIIVNSDTTINGGEFRNLIVEYIKNIPNELSPYILNIVSDYCTTINGGTFKGENVGLFLLKEMPINKQPLVLNGGEFIAVGEDFGDGYFDENNILTAIAYLDDEGYTIKSFLEEGKMFSNNPTEIANDNPNPNLNYSGSIYLSEKSTKVVNIPDKETEKEQPDLNKQPVNEETTSNKPVEDNKLDETPKTGNIEYISIVPAIGIMVIITLAVTVLIKRK